MTQQEDTSKGFVFFWGGPLSQWTASPFKLQGRVYSTAEQYMMYKKAVYFNDEVIAQSILETSDPRQQKALGRRVENFDPDAWASVASSHVFTANLAKFKQNEAFKTYLMSTKEAMIVEASPYDNIWGIGFSEQDAKKTLPEIWMNHDNNLLGKALMEVRKMIIQDEVINIHDYNTCPEIYYYPENMR